MLEKNKQTLNGKEKTPRPTFCAMDKAKAVLSVWTEKRKSSEVCRDLSIKWALLQHWQDRALEGMLTALAPRQRLEKSVELNPRLAALLEKRIHKAQQAGTNLEERLQKLQSPRNQDKKQLKLESDPIVKMEKNS